MNRLKELRQAKGLNQKEAAQILGIAQPTLSGWETGRTQIDRENLMKVADFYEVSLDYLFGRTQEKSSCVPAYPDIFSVQKKEVPLLGKIACGEPILTEETFEGYMQCGSKHHVDFCLRASGDSMINARIYDGDIVFIRQQPEVENGEIAAVAIDNAVTLKRVYIEEDCIILRAENPRIKPMRFKKEDFDQFKILGKAVVFQGDVI